MHKMPPKPNNTPKALRQVKRSTPFKIIAPAIKDQMGVVPLKMPPMVGATKRCPQERAAKGSKISIKPISQGRHNCLGEMRKSLRCRPYNTTKNRSPVSTRKKVHQ